MENINIEYFDINSASDQFRTAYDIYIKSIPAGEKRSSIDLKLNLIKDGEKLTGGKLDNKIVMMGLVWHVIDSEFLFLDSLAVDENYRNKGIGTDFIKKIFSLFGDTCNKIIFETKPSNDDPDSSENKKINFFTKLGAKKLTGFKYHVPSKILGKPPEERILMVISKNNDATMEGPLIRDILNKIYHHIYHQNYESNALSGVLNDIPRQIKLE